MEDEVRYFHSYTSPLKSLNESDISGLPAVGRSDSDQPCSSSFSRTVTSVLLSTLQKLLTTSFLAFRWRRRLMIEEMSFYGASKPKVYHKLSQWHA